MILHSPLFMYLHVHLESFVRNYAHSCRRGMPVLQSWDVQSFLKQLVHVHDKLSMRLHQQKCFTGRETPILSQSAGKTIQQTSHQDHSGPMTNYRR